LSPIPLARSKICIANRVLRVVVRVVGSAGTEQGKTLRDATQAISDTL
jgi:hypothetical protein